MKKTIRRRGQKFIRKFSRASTRASEDSKEHIRENLIGRFSHIANIRLLILEWGLLVLALIMLACTQAFWFRDSYAGDVFTGGGTYTEATVGSVNSMNPLFATTSSEKTLSRLLFATITTNDYSGHAGLGLASSVTAEEGGRVWRVHLREGLKWSDDEPITNADVIFTAELIKNPAVNTIYDYNLGNVKVSENEFGEVVFELPTAYADFDVALNVPILPKHILEGVDPKTLIEANFSVNPVTSGAFTFNAVQSGATSDEKVYYLSANDRYYKGKPLLNSFAIHTYADNSAVMAAIEAGAVTATAELTATEASQITSGQFNRKNSSLNSGAFIFFNVSSKAVENVEIRAAIRQGVNIDKLRAAVPETMTLDYPLLSSQIELTNYPEIPEHDAGSARTKIAGNTEGAGTRIEITTVSTGYLPAVAEALAEELRGLGLEADVSIYEENQDFISNVISKRSYDILIYEVELGADPDLLPYYHSSQTSASGLNLSNYRNELVDDLLLGARDTLDKDLRIKKYESLLEYLVADVPVIGLYQPNLTYVYNRNVRTYGDSVKLVTGLDRFVDVENWATTKTVKNCTP